MKTFQYPWLGFLDKYDFEVVQDKMATHYLAATSCGAAFCILASIFFFFPGGPVGRMAVLYLNTDVKVFKCRFTFLLFASIHTIPSPITQVWMGLGNLQQDTLWSKATPISSNCLYISKIYNESLIYQLQNVNVGDNHCFHAGYCPWLRSMEEWSLSRGNSITACTRWALCSRWFLTTLVS